jgi:predicted membrane protein
MQNLRNNRTLGIGLVVIAIGLGFLLRQMNVFSPSLDDILFSWQMLLILIGLFAILFGESKTLGFILLIVGGFFLLPDIFSLPFNFRNTFWPILLILAGFFILFRSGLFGHKQKDINMKPRVDEINYFDEVNIFSGSERKISGIELKGGKVTSIFGGSELDLSEAKLSAGINVIEVLYIFGGSAITIPADWHVINQVTAVLGGFSDKRAVTPSQKGSTEKTLILKGLVVFGGGEIKTR